MKAILLLLLTILSFSAFSQNTTGKVVSTDTIKKRARPKDELEVLWDSMLVKNKLKSKQEFIDKASAKIDKSIGEFIIKGVEILSFISLVVLLLGIWFSAIEEIIDDSWSGYGLMNLVVLGISVYITYRLNPKVYKIIKYFLFKRSDPGPEDIKFSNVYDNIASYYSSVNEIPLASKLISTIVLICTILGGIKAVYETYVFFSEKLKDLD